MDLGRGIRVIIFAIVGCIVLALLWWLVDFIGFPAPMGHVLHVVIVVVAVLVIIGFLLQAAGINPWRNDGGGGL